MKRATRGLLSFVTAFLIVFSTFGNAFLVAEASEPTSIEETVTAADSAAELASTEEADTDITTATKTPNIKNETKSLFLSTQAKERLRQPLRLALQGSVGGEV